MHEVEQAPLVLHAACSAGGKIVGWTVGEPSMEGVRLCSRPLHSAYTFLLTWHLVVAGLALLTLQ